MKRTLGEKIFDILNYTFLLLITLIAVYPVIHVLFASFSDGTELLTHHGLLLKPLKFTIDGYMRVLDYKMIMVGYKNTIFIVVIGVVVNLIMTSLCAYVLSRKNLMFKKQLMLFVIFTMYFNGGLIPTYLVVKNLGLTDNILALILPVAINTYNMIILRSAFESIPAEIQESARIDGINDFNMLLKIMLPLVMPTMAVMVLYYGVAHWNSWFNAMIYLRTKELYPLQLILREILLQGETAAMTGSDIGALTQVGETVKYATIMISILPVLCIYPFVQRYFVNGIMIGAVKG